MMLSKTARGDCLLTAISLEQVDYLEQMFAAPQPDGNAGMIWVTPQWVLALRREAEIEASIQEKLRLALYPK